MIRTCSAPLLPRAVSGAIGLAVAALLSIPAWAQVPPANCSWDNGIGQPGMNNDVWVLLEHDDGTGPALYAGGRFTMAGGAAANGIARRTGQEWVPLGDGIGGVTNPTVHALAIFDDGDGPALYAGGAFTTAGGQTANRIARWDDDAWTALGDGLDNNVRALAVYDDGSGPALYAGGTFQQAGGEPVVGIARWDGEVWTALGDGLGGGLPYVYSLTVFDDGTGPALYAGGTFITAGGKSATNIARWDGQEWSPVGGGVNQWVTALSVFDDATGPALYAGGAFTTAGGKPALRVARWDGEEWAPLGAGITGDFPWVEALAGFDDGTGPALHVGGWFWVAGGLFANRIAKWDGKEWRLLRQGLNERVWDLLVFDDGDGPALYVAGHFTQAQGQAANRIARWVCEEDVATEGVPDGHGALRLSTYPNPASSAVTLTFAVPESGPVRLVIYDLLGREVIVLAEGPVAAGTHTMPWDSGDMAPGIYVVHLATGGGTTSRRVVVMR